MRRLKSAAADLWDRFSASDPGLIRSISALTTVGAILLALLVLELLHTSVVLLVVGALGAMVASFAVSDPRPRDQAVTLALGLPVALAAIGLGAELYKYRAASDAVFVLLIFAAVYVRRFGPRGTGLGQIAFQIYFVSQFTHADPAQLPHLCAVLALAFGSAALVRFGLVRSTPERTLDRLRHAFRIRLAETVGSCAELAAAPPGSHAAEAAGEELHRHTVRLHQCALMIQARLELSTADATTAALLERRIAEAEIAAERLGRLLTLALADAPGEAASGKTDSGAAPSGKTDSGNAASGKDESGEWLAAPEPAMLRLADELQVTRVLVLRTGPGPQGADFFSARDRLLGYRDDSGLPPDASARVQDVYRALGEMARGMLGLRMALGGGSEPGEDEDEDADDSPQTARSREELDTEDLYLRAAETEPSSPAPAAPTGLDRLSTRLAFQVSTGSALAILGGELLSTQRWYWAVLTCWVVFLNTSSTGDILVKGYRRLAGTVVGVVAGAGLAGLVGGDPWIAFTLVIVCVFGMFFTAPLSYTLMSFFVTTMIGLLYTLLGTFSASVLVLRIEETGVGAACGFIAAVFVLPVQISRHTDERLVDVLERLRATLSLAVSRLAGGPAADLLHSARALDTALDALHASAEPITHPASPLRARRRRARYIMGLLDSCAYHARSLAAVAEMIADTPRLGVEPRLARVGQRLDHNVSVLAEFVASEGRRAGRLESEPGITTLLEPPEGQDASRGTSSSVPAAATATAAALDSPITRRVVRHFQRLDEAVLGLARPLGLNTADDAKRADPPHAS